MCEQHLCKPPLEVVDQVLFFLLNLLAIGDQLAQKPQTDAPDHVMMYDLPHSLELASHT